MAACKRFNLNTSDSETMIHQAIWLVFVHVEHAHYVEPVVHTYRLESIWYQFCEYTDIMCVHDLRGASWMVRPVHFLSHDFVVL